MKTLVIGGTGKVGSAVVRELLRRKTNVRMMVRRQEAVVPDGVEKVNGDLLDPLAVAKALDGVDKLFLLNAVVPDELTQGLIAFALAKRKKLKHVVYLSVFGADRFQDVAHFASKAAIENAMRASDLPFTIRRPNYFMQNDLGLKDALTKAGIYPIPLGRQGVSAVDIRDIAEVAAIALTTDGHEGKTYNLNGPDALSGPRAAAIWTDLLGSPVRYAGEDMDGFEEQMRGMAPAWLAFDMRMMFQRYLERGFLAEAGDVANLTALLGHPPRNYQDFAREAAEKWRS